MIADAKSCLSYVQSCILENNLETAANSRLSELTLQTGMKTITIHLTSDLSAISVLNAVAGALPATAIPRRRAVK